MRCLSYLQNHRPWIVVALITVMVSACAPVRVLDHDRMLLLPGAGMLGLRVDELFDRCGLPSTINDAETDVAKRHHLRWRETSLTLSGADWAIGYAGDSQLNGSGRTWVNPGKSDASCRDGISRLVLIARGQAGMLRTVKRPDGRGYVTTYDIPDDQLAAHRIAGISVEFMEGWTRRDLEQHYGPPDEVHKRLPGITYSRYWVRKNRDGLAALLYAVDFEFHAGTPRCARMIIQDDSFAPVQKHGMESWQDWERGALAD